MLGSQNSHRRWQGKRKQVMFRICSRRPFIIRHVQ